MVQSTTSTTVRNQRRQRGALPRVRLAIGAALVILAWRQLASMAVGTETFILTGRRPVSAQQLLTRKAAGESAAGVLGQEKVEEDDDIDPEDIDIWTMDKQELALDVRELLITEPVLYFVGPDTASYHDVIREITDMLNYTWVDFTFTEKEGGRFDIVNQMVPSTKKVLVVPPLASAVRWPWAALMQGLVIWLDPDDHTKLDAEKRNELHLLKNPPPPKPVGPNIPYDFKRVSRELQPFDPIDMWQEADIHVEINKRTHIPLRNRILASMINGMLASPPKWREWFRAAKARGTVPQNYQTPLQIHREYHSHGMSNRLQKLLTA